MMTLYTGNKNSMRFCWIEENDSGKCAMMAINLDEEEAKALAESFKEYGAPPDMEWMDGVRSILDGMSDISELAQHE